MSNNEFKAMYQEVLQLLPLGLVLPKEEEDDDE